MASVPEQFAAFVARELPELPRARTLLAVSGGLDSMAMAWLCVGAGWSVGIAHCNFCLRGAESDGDEAFVRAFAEAQGVPFFGRRLDARAEARKQGISIQMAARRLRYAWFEELAVREGYDYVATAHHLDDHFETVLLNMLRGTGLRGLQGIPLRRGRIVRPLLGLSRPELEQWMRSEGHAWREDRSNATLDYERNYLRHRVLPVLDHLRPSWRQAYGRNSAFVRDGLQLWEEAVTRALDALVERQGEAEVLDLEALRRQPGGRALLREWLAPRGFSGAQVWDVWACSRSGAQFASATHVVWYDRGRLLLRPRTEDNWGPLEWPSPEEPLALPDGRILCAELLDEPPRRFPDDPAQAWLDADKVQWPLRVRAWQPGDRFRPLGMGGRSKKLQDLFSDLKLPVPEKKRVPVVECGGQICWVAGLRADERFKVGPETRRVWHLWLGSPGS